VLPSPAGPEQISGELSDREQAKAALRRALDGNNMAAMVAGAKALLEFDKSDPWADRVSVEDAQAQLIAKLDQIDDHRRRNGEVCPECGGEVCETCDGRGYVLPARPVSEPVSAGVTRCGAIRSGR
jgi:hypothetical protein